MYMNNTTRKENEELYQCPVCGMHYRDKTTAESCQAWCTEHKSCNLDIIKHAIQDSAEGTEGNTSS